jgi:hypothetical protein
MFGYSAEYAIRQRLCKPLAPSHSRQAMQQRHSADSLPPD